MIVVRKVAESRDLTSVETVKEVLSITDQSKDVQLARLITNASSLIEEFTGRVFGREIVTEILGADDSGFVDEARFRLMLRRRPVLIVQAARLDGSDVDIATIVLDDPEAGILFRREGFGDTQITMQDIARRRTGVLDPLWEVDYSAGYILPSFEKVTKTFVDADVNATTETISITTHGLEDGDAVRFTSDGVLPTGLSAGRDFYVRDTTTGTFKVASQKGGAAVNLTADGSGTHTLDRQATLPGALESIAIDLVTSMFRSEGRDINIEAESLGDYRVTYAKGNMNDGLPPRVRASLARWAEVV